MCNFVLGLSSYLFPTCMTSQISFSLNFLYPFFNSQLLLVILERTLWHAPPKKVNEAIAGLPPNLSSLRLEAGWTSHAYLYLDSRIEPPPTKFQVKHGSKTRLGEGWLAENQRKATSSTVIW